MKNYKLTIFNQSRVIAIVFLFPISLFGSLFAGLELMLKSCFWVVSIPMFAGFSAINILLRQGEIIV